MIKWILMSLLVSYLFRRFIFTPLNQQTHYENQQTQYGNQQNRAEPKSKRNTKNKETDQLGEYTDYEEIK